MYKIVLLLMLVTIYGDDINIQFATERTLPSIRIRGLAGAGVAIPGDALTAMLNPSLPHSALSISGGKVSTAVSFYRDSLFNKYAISGGSCLLIDKKISIASSYKHLKNSNRNYQNATILTIGTELFEASQDQGAAMCGINVHYTDTRWGRLLDSTTTQLAIYDSNGVLDSNHVINYYEPVQKYLDIEDRSLFFDIGFYQKNTLIDGLDFGLVFHNFFGYTWHKESPELIHYVDILSDSLPNDVVYDTIVDSSYYDVKETIEKKDAINKSYKRMTIGLAYLAPLVDGKLNIRIPVDLEFIGVFYKKMDTKISLHTGAEVFVGNSICLRFGYAYAPGAIFGTGKGVSIEHYHQFSGGLGLKIKAISADLFFMGQDEFGLGVAVIF